MNKKGIFFTILAIALLSLFLVSYSVYSFVQNREGINKRIKTMNSYVSSLEEDIPRKLYITGYRIIFVLEEEVIKNGTYITNLNSAFSEAFFNGTIKGIDYTSPDEYNNSGLLLESTFEGTDGIKDKINDKANSLNIDVTFINPEVNLSQDDPWHIKVSLKSNLIIKDRGNMALWNKTADYYVYIPIENFEDPLYIVNTNAKVVNKFVKTPYNVPVLTANLTNHFENSYYINHTDAPSFLKRLQGDLSADPNGIESLVNTHKLSIQGIEVKDRCVIDYLYFSGPGCDIAEIHDSWIKIDSNHTETYGE
ncbi:MAG: hypothetical protein PHH54_01380 [Candidatus Nanoarchaeia archaeon]|nr:hypothetical protein [Candidatus Nanoarchaeia archaeon]MDD5740615.1 hypothetical protein [Candidatus Nanoarchaeia archaeon]